MDIKYCVLVQIFLCGFFVVFVALLRKSTAADFLKPVREKRAAECFPAGCSMEDSETEELLEANSHFVSSGWQTHWSIDSKYGSPNIIVLLKFMLQCSSF